ncbi:uncharacterized protein LOC123695005 [Colias croceus]|uniref:uncharacterized protein LOC123695005 n=1 Tax=Colias crocea TaxID=72248 RepID=UPI001E27B28E|nr:uncharacterized protein LOC123695005 [Colias croceus]
MLRVLILTITLSCVNTQSYYNAASEAQQRFAIQNRYDDTGPGAKGPESAYNTYRSLEEALISYIDDPDTKLPDHERAKIARFVNTDYNQPIREYPKSVEEYTGQTKPSRPAQRRPIPSFYQQNYQPNYQPYYQPNYQPVSPATAFQTFYRPEKFVFQDPSNKFSFLDFRGSDLRQTLQGERLDFKVPKVQPVRSSPLSLAHFTRSDEEQFDVHHDPHPQYTFSYGVNDKKTGDSKSAHETRDGGSVKGYYTFVDPDGKQRTVHYTADDKLGFRATVQRTPMNSQ